MTCIVGLLDKNEDCVYIGADSLGSSYFQQATYKNRKVFKAKDNKDVLMAICGDYKLQNFLSIEDGLIDELKHLKNEVDFEHIVKHTALKIFNLASKYGCLSTQNGYTSIEGSVLFAYKDKLYLIESNGQVLIPEDEYVTGGSGASYSIGVLSQNQDKDSITRITEALISAEKHGCGIKRPFYIMNTKNDDVITIN